MLDTMNFGAFKTGYGSGQLRESAAFALDIRPGQPLRDRISGVEAICNIPGDRWGVVNGILTRIPAYKAAVLDDGLRVCPKFTQEAKYTEDLTSTYWNKSGILTPALFESFQGQNVFRIAESSAGASAHYIRQSVVFSGIADNSVIGFSCIIKPAGRNVVQAAIGDKAGVYSNAIFNLTTGTVSGMAVGMVAYIEPESDGYFRIFFAKSAGTGASTPVVYFVFMNDLSQNAYLGDGVSGVLMGQPTYINFGVNGIPFIPPYIPNNTSSSVSVVSEAGTSTTGTSFDLDAATLARLKTGLRGVGVGSNLWVGTVNLYAGWSDDGTNYVSAGGNDFYPIRIDGVTVPEQIIEVTFSTGDTASGTLIVYANTTGVSIPSISPNTTYTVRMLGDNASILALTSSTFIGEIVKSSISFKPVFAQGRIELTFKTNFDSDDFPGGVFTRINILSTSNSSVSLLYAQKESSGEQNYTCLDAAFNYCRVVAPFPTRGSTVAISIDWGVHPSGQKMRITVNGVKSAIATFCGSLGFKNLLIGFDNKTDAFRLQDCVFYDRPRW